MANGEPQYVNVELFRSPRVAIGMFRCATSYAEFGDTGPTHRSLVVFPRTSVWIAHQGSPRFLADPTIATIYNNGQRYRRFPGAPDGDRSDWFGLSDDLAREIVRAFDEAAADAPRPFRLQWSSTPATLYLRQRVVFHRARLGMLDALQAEEEVIAIAATVFASGYGRAPRRLARRAGAAARHRDIADAARFELAGSLHENRSVHDIAVSLGTSAFHLCRVFHACMGRTLHEYRSELRVRRALEMLESRSPSAPTLSTVAQDLGFSSHSHFVQAMRRHAGLTPSAARALVADRS